MSTFWRRVRLCVMLMLLGGGCNPLWMPFVFQNDEPTIKAEMYRLYDPEKKNQKEVRVVILTDTGPVETRAEFLHADKEIARLLALHLQKQCQQNKEKVAVINPLKVEEFKNSHPDWNEEHLDLEALGKQFKADYVIYIEASDLTLYQPNTANQFYQGRANLTVKLLRVSKPDDFNVEQRVETFSYPPESQGGNILADADMTPQAFRLKFFNAMARHLTGFFTDRPTRDTYLKD